MPIYFPQHGPGPIYFSTACMGMTYTGRLIRYDPFTQKATMLNIHETVLKDNHGIVNVGNDSIYGFWPTKESYNEIHTFTVLHRIRSWKKVSNLSNWMSAKPSI